MEEKKLEYFIPARALEHPDNPDDFNLDQKLRMAVLRFFLTKDYLGTISVPDRSVWVFLQERQFNPEKMGYHARAVIKRG